MIESKTLSQAVGIQYRGVTDLSETNTPDTMSVGMIVGKFLRGFPNRPFKVTSQNYRAMLGHTPKNPAYMAVMDALNSGMNEIWVIRTGLYTK
ncbi:MAG: hypothetical protein Q4B81_00290 [Moraxella sp.]|nr:hypothetical protein [Moraxella sp.]